ncbi:MAG: helix-turn-helix domain-containing protein, partial [Gallionellaceae bacterium]|nr:helix-turn-helix domain-containing protein [Gallionellaceae bacterium]
IEDLPALVDYFVGQLAPRLNVPPLVADQETLARLAAYDWPGNVRELKNLVERSLILGYLADDFLVDALATSGQDMAAGMAASGDADTDDSLLVVERRHILAVLRACAGNKSEAARRLGISRKTLERKCIQWGV